MATEVQTNSEPGIASLLKGIVNDFRDLIKQQFQFARTELKADLKKTGKSFLSELRDKQSSKK